MHRTFKDVFANTTLAYLSLSKSDFKNIENSLVSFNNVVLSMIRNAVFVLPKDKKKNGVQSINSLYQIKKNIKDFKYEEFVDTKKIFLYCIRDKHKRHIFDNAISRIILDKNKKIRFVCKKSFYNQIDNKTKQIFKNDIRKIEIIVNNVNTNFQNLLPIAVSKRKTLLNKMRTSIIPNKARYIDDNNKKR